MNAQQIILENLEQQGGVFITRKEIISLLGRSASGTDKFIARETTFPPLQGRGIYSRKQVLAWLEQRDLI